MQIYVAQVKPMIGGLDFNFKIIKDHYREALDRQCSICMFPELVTTGYTPQDLLLKPGFIRELDGYVKDLTSIVGSTALLLPTPIQTQYGLENGVIAIQNGEIIGQTGKKHIVNYGIFDEKRYFISGTPQIINVNGMRIGVPVCEDIWFDDVTKKLKAEGAELFLVPNGSPFEKGKFDVRLNMVRARFNETKVPIIYCNQVLGQDGIIYDGRSFGYDGELKFVLKPFVEDVGVIRINDNTIVSGKRIDEYADCDLAYGAMVLGLHDYVVRNNFDTVLLGLSGGIDSALVSAIATDSLGGDKVYTTMMPSCFTSKESIKDAESVAKLLGTHHRVIDISPIVDAAKNIMPNMSDVAYENLQARVRGVVLMTTSNSTGRMVLTTGNKSETATGYTTLYGDTCGAFNPIKDLYKTDVFKISKFRNSAIPKSIPVQNPVFPVMPERILIKPPSAELKFNQKDSDSLPQYDVLDRILYLYIECDLSVDEIVAQGFDSMIVNKVVHLVKSAEYKRRQSAPGVRLSPRPFGRERDYPITSGYKG
ncbi:NAD+ synthase [Rickettsiales endosymbiont of Peranema trichophorum]|uniref:NAD+ synthase n=1 Tax=Rickettsiales endosymbiont of Peranema trichophorum TaxID=2486577 RepID=UPI00102331BB|nr:NAD+ synthase [Rickettsiales endosymbiont of Peranema trichophorum]RZI47551.1 NAD+ synthase [Rickettsiales endosymbiont of Peranema trichophorum]